MLGAVHQAFEIGHEPSHVREHENVVGLSLKLPFGFGVQLLGDANLFGGEWHRVSGHLAGGGAPILEFGEERFDGLQELGFVDHEQGAFLAGEVVEPAEADAVADLAGREGDEGGVIGAAVKRLVERGSGFVGCH